MNELAELKNEIKTLNKRISHLENQERKRSAFKRIRLIFKILMILALIYGVWYAYDYVTNSIPNQIKNGITELIPSVFE